MIQEAEESMMVIPYGFYAGFNYVINCTQAINFPILRHMIGKVDSVKLPGQGQLLHNCLHVHPATIGRANREDSCELSRAHDPSRQKLTTWQDLHTSKKALMGLGHVLFHQATSPFSLWPQTMRSTTIPSCYQGCNH